MNILTVNLLFSTLCFGLLPGFTSATITRATTQSVLLPILLLHSLRHLGLMFLAPGATYAGISQQFAYPAAYGDLLAALLALVAIRLWQTTPGAASPRMDLQPRRTLDLVRSNYTGYNL